MLNVNPMMTRVAMGMFAVLGVTILGAMLAGMTHLYILTLSPIAYIAYRLYKSKDRKNKAIETIKSEFNENVKMQILAHHKKSGFGLLGVSENYIYFFPKKKSEEPIYINVKYITNYGSDMVGTGNFATVSHDYGSTTSQIKLPTFYCEGNANGQPFIFSWVTDGIKPAGKLFKQVSQLPNAPQEMKENRKLI